MRVIYVFLYTNLPFKFNFEHFNKSSLVDSIEMFKTRVLVTGINPGELLNKDSLLKPSI